MSFHTKRNQGFLKNGWFQAAADSWNTEISTRGLLVLNVERECWGRERFHRHFKTAYTSLLLLGLITTVHWTSKIHPFIFFPSQTILLCCSKLPFYWKAVLLIVNFFAGHSCHYLAFTKAWLFLEDSAFPVRYLSRDCLLSYTLCICGERACQYPLLTNGPSRLLFQRPSLFSYITLFFLTALVYYSVSYQNNIYQTLGPIS